MITASLLKKDSLLRGKCVRVNGVYGEVRGVREVCVCKGVRVHGVRE